METFIEILHRHPVIASLVGVVVVAAVVVWGRYDQRREFAQRTGQQPPRR